MASSGTIYTNYAKSSCLYLNWRVSQTDIANNRSLISWDAGISVANGNLWYYNAVKITGIYIGGGSSLGSGTYSNITSNGLHGKLSGSKWVTHNNDGSLSINLAIYGWFYAYGNVSGGKDTSLPSIPRKATLTSVPNINDENAFNISWYNPAATAASLQLNIEDGKNKVLAYWGLDNKTTTGTRSCTYAESEKENLRNFCKDANSKTVLITLRTQIGSNVFWDSHYKTLTIINNEPIFTTTPTAKNNHPDTSSLRGNNDSSIIKGVNKIIVSAGITLKKNATLKSFIIKNGISTKSLKTTNGTAEFVNSESGKVTITAIDSRNNSITKEINLSVYDYIKPTLTLDVDTPTASGVTNVSTKGNWFTGMFANSIKNKVKVEFLFRESGKAYPDAWTNLTPSTPNGSTYTLVKNITGLDYKKEYIFKARITDSVYKNGVESKEISVKSIPVFDWGKNDFSFNVPVTIMGVDMTITDAEFQQLLNLLEGI